MKFLGSILGSERDRAAKKRRSLEVSLHRLEEKTFLLEMELEETRRQREKIIKELRSSVPVRHVSTISDTSTDFCFNTDSSTISERVFPIESKTSEAGKEQDAMNFSRSKPTMSYNVEEPKNLPWLEGQNKTTKRVVEKY